MDQGAYRRRSIATVIAALASFPAALVIGSSLSEGSGISGTFVTMLLLVPAALFVAALYWLAISRKRARDAGLPIEQRLSLYTAPFGAASAFIALPALLTGSAPAFKMSVAAKAAWLAEIFLPLGFLLMATWYLCSTPGRPEAIGTQPFRWPFAALSAYFIACLAPAFLRFIGWIVPFNSFQLQGYATLGLPPALPASLTLVALVVLLARDLSGPVAVADSLAQA